jgi:catechol 2,3-dioxygenase-like lactoylglutathione lyase family enzyme
MFRYITVGTSDLAAAIRFYDAVLATLGHVRLSADGREAGWGPPGGQPHFWANLPFDGRPASAGNGAMPAFAAPSRDAVDAFHKAGLTAGGTDEGAPGLRPYGADFYACYLRDPDGNKLSAVHEGGATA